MQVASALCASYVGGSVNFAATSQSLGLTPGPVLAASMAADNIAMAMYLTGGAAGRSLVLESVCRGSMQRSRSSRTPGSKKYKHYKAHLQLLVQANCCNCLLLLSCASTAAAYLKQAQPHAVAANTTRKVPSFAFKIICMTQSAPSLRRRQQLYYSS